MDEKKGRGIKFISNKLNLYDAFIGLVIILGIILLINIFLTLNLSKDLRKSTEAAKELARPAKIELAVIKNSGCQDCFDILPFLNYLKSSKANITKENVYEFDSADGKQLVSKYGIQKIPSVIVTGEISKIQMQGLVKNNDALVFLSPNPPYTNAATGKIEGRVTLYSLIDSQCTKCKDINPLIAQIKGAGILISEQKNLTLDSDEGKELIKKYNIGFVPAIVLSRDAAAYGLMQKAWPQIGSREADGSYVLRLAAPPFINLSTGKLRGVVDVAYLTDKSCTECYDVNLHRQVLTNVEVKPDKEDTFDVSDARGKALIAEYNITQVPTVILSSEVSIYPSAAYLRQFFSVEKDGSYVFRKLSAIGTYKDLSTNQVVKAPAPVQGAQAQ